MAVRDGMILTFLHERDEMHGKCDMIKKNETEERRKAVCGDELHTNHGLYYWGLDGIPVP